MKHSSHRGSVGFSASEIVHGRKLSVGRRIAVMVAALVAVAFPLQQVVRAAQVPSGPTSLGDFNQLTLPSGARSLVDVGGVLFFVADDGLHGQELWQSDGTSAGTRLVKDIFSEPGASSSPSSLVNVGGTLFFAAENPDNGLELWTSDGTTVGTHIVADIFPGDDSGDPQSLTAVGSTLFFSADDGSNGRELWKSDGTAGGTSRVADIVPGTGGSSPQNLTNVGGTLFFSANDGTSGDELWMSDGTVAGTSRVADIVPGTGGSYPQNLTNVGGTLFFSANDNSGDNELWKSNGAGASRVADIQLGTSSSYPQNFKDVGGTLFFSANEGTNGKELWKSNGTLAGTMRVADISPGTGDSSPLDLTDVGGTLFFSANDGTNGIELWTSDGTDAGTRMVKDIRNGAESGLDQFGAWLVTFGSRVVFVATDDATGAELWTSDGSAGGTSMVKDVNNTTRGTEPMSVTAAGDKFFMSMDDGIHGRELWVTDGTAGGTSMVKDICTGSTSSMQNDGDSDASWSTRRLATVGSRAYFVADDCQNGRELWVSDGTSGGTTMVADLTPGVGGSTDIAALTPLGTSLLFMAYTSTDGWELWRTDGTAGGTSMVKDIYPGTNDAMSGTTEGRLTYVIDNKMYFVARNAANGYELWSSDGTSAGTSMVKDLTVGSGDSFNMGTRPAYASLGGYLYFVADPAGQGSTLWRTDGTPGGTSEVAPGAGITVMSQLVTMGSHIYFVGNDGTYGSELWRSDGTASGTTMVKDVNPSGNALEGNTQFKNVTVFDSRVYFAADDGAIGRELWSTDGTASGTSLVSDIVAGPNGSNPQRFTAFGSNLYFSADDNDNLYVYDGTSTTRVTLESSSSAQARWLSANVTTLLFSGRTATQGSEPWIYSVPAPPASTTPTTVPVSTTTVSGPASGTNTPLTPTTTVAGAITVNTAPTTTIVSSARSATKQPKAKGTSALPFTGSGAGLIPLAVWAIALGVVFNSVVPRLIHRLKPSKAD